MSEVLRISKRILTVGVVVTTIAWAVGFAAFVMPLTANAATLAAGDLIKASQAAVYYYDTDGKRYVFPNENTYYSWYSDFSGVKEISDTELAAVPIGGNVTIRPGTFLVKITTDPKVYAVTTGGMLHWVETADIAQKLWLSNWADWVVDVPDSFFTNYTVSTDTVNSYVHPDGCLIKYAADPTVYYIQGGQKRAITSEAAFYANRFQWRFVIDPVAADVTYPDGTDITGKEAGLIDITVGAAGSGTGLTATLSTDTPAGATVAKGSSAVELIKTGFQASSDGNVILNSLKFKRIGVGSAADFANVYLYKGTSRLTSGRSINTSSNEVQFNNLNIDIAAGDKIELSVVGDIAAGATTADEHALQILEAGFVGTAASVAGNFPITGNTFVIGAQGAATLTATKGTTPSNPTIGEAHATVSSFKLQASSADITLYQVRLMQAGTITNSDITELTLWVGTSLVASSPTMDGEHMLFVLSSPYLITNGQTKTFYVKATIAGKPGRTIRTYFEYETDIAAIDNSYGWGADVDITGFDGTTAAKYVEVTTQGGQVTIAFNGPTTGNVAKGSQDQVFFLFNMTAAETAIEVRKMRFTLQGIAAGDYLDVSGTDLFTDIKVIDVSSDGTLMGPTQLSSGEGVCGTDVTTCTWTLTDTFDIAAGETRQLGIAVDIANNAWFNTDRNYRVDLQPWGADYIKDQESGDYVPTSKIVPNSLVNGNTQTVKASALTVNLAATPVSKTWVKKTSGVPSVGFVFTAGSQSDITVSNVKITGTGATGGTTTSTANFINVVNAVSLWDGATQLGVSKTPDTTTGEATFDGFQWTVPAGESKTLMVKGTLDSVASTGYPDQYWIGIAAAGDITAEDKDNNAVTPADSGGGWTNPPNNTPTIFQTVLNSGALTVSPESNPDSDIIIAGKDAWYPFAQAKATAQYEDIEIDKIRVERFAGGSNGTFQYLGITHDGVLVSSGTDVLPTGATATDILLTAPIVVPADGNVAFQVVGKINGIDLGATSGDDPILAIEYNIQTGEWNVNYANNYNIRSTGDQSGERIYSGATAPLSGNKMVVRRTKITVARQALSTSSLTNGTIELYKAQFSSDSAGDASFAKVAYDLTQTGAFTINNLRWLRDGTDVSEGAGVGEVEIVDAAGVNVEGTNPASGTIFIQYNSGTEQTIYGSGSVFTLRGTVAGAGSGESLNVNFHTATGTTVYTLPLSWAGTIQPPNLQGVDAYFVWSDKSAIPHNANDGGSADWTNYYLIKDLSENVVLSY